MSVRRIISCFAVACIVAAGLSSCVVNEKITPVEEDRTIWYNIAPVKELPQTKAVNEFDKSKTFGSYAYKGSDLFINNEEISYQTDKWVAKDGSKYYWPYSGTLTFISYAPYSLSSRPGFSCTAASGISLSNVSLPNKVGYYEESNDILVADIARDLTKESHPMSGVPTVFKHKLCKVAIKASRNSELNSGEYVRITGINLQNIYTEGNYTQSAGWSSQNGLKDYSNPSISSSPITLALEPTFVFNETLMIPQTTTLSDRGPGKEPKLIVNYSVKLNGSSVDNKTAELKLYSGPSSPAAWEEGKVVTYYISISTKDEYIEFSGSLDAWDDAGNSDINMGL